MLQGEEACFNTDSTGNPLDVGRVIHIIDEDPSAALQSSEEVSAASSSEGAQRRKMQDLKRTIDAKQWAERNLVQSDSQRERFVKSYKQIEKIEETESYSPSPQKDPII
jgi:hypothetical protein